MSDIISKIREMQRESYRSLLSEYAAGTLTEALDVLVCSHLILSPKARKFVNDCEQVAGAMMENMCEPASLNNDALLNVLKMIEESENSADESYSVAEISKEYDVPLPLAEFISCNMDKASWKRGIRKVEYFNIPTNDSRIISRLVKLGAGQIIPNHMHKRVEYSLILEGGFSDQYGIYKEGDLLVMDEGTIHEVKADEMNGCTYLSVTSCPVSFSNPVYRVLNIIYRY